MRQMEEDQNIDMLSRMLDTLDYPLVLQALADECDSAFGKDLVRQSLTDYSRDLDLKRSLLLTDSAGDAAGAGRVGLEGHVAGGQQRDQGENLWR